MALKNLTIVLLRVPKGAKELAVRMQDAALTIWAEVDPDATLITREYWIIMTGGEIPDDAHFIYIGTVQDRNLIYHVWNRHSPLINQRH